MQSWFTGNDRGDGLEPEPEPVLRCAWCNLELGRVAIRVETTPQTADVCSDLCKDDLLAHLGADA
jgi:hypothetical protein